MASNSTKKSQSSRMSILWLSGRKSHSKDHFSATNKHISKSEPQKKFEMGSLGGSTAQSELTYILSDSVGAGNVHAPPSLSLVAPCLLGAPSGKSESGSSTEGLSAIVSETATVHCTVVTACSPAPWTPSSRAMTSPNVITTAEIEDSVSCVHRVTLDLINLRCFFLQPNIMGPEDLHKVRTAAGETKLLLNGSEGRSGTMTQDAQDPDHSQQKNPQQIKYRNHNNNQEDINSIESISSLPSFQGNATDFDWIDEMVKQRNRNEMMHKKQKKASKKGLERTLQPEADQLDGQMYSFNNNDKDKSNSSKDNDGDDELVVKCLYYSLMCCDCRIS
ncbi:hypothetical protein KR038_007534 [Drosophila bunnanda]|nr:hypothetical protein KR038_007534 [Drosophila bunnanda]